MRREVEDRLFFFPFAHSRQHVTHLQSIYRAVSVNYPTGKIPDVRIAKSFLGRIHSSVRGSMFLKIRMFLSDDNGPTAVEYAVMLVLIIAVVLASVSRVGRGRGRQLSQLRPNT